MQNLQEISKDKRCNFIPQLIDIVTPEISDHK